ncbi:type I restriction enzyme S subunit [Paraburkholderia sp. JPY158]|uniref:Type I restriction enzyme S subunit n=1 Tax=Paraburkholderia atlantica TaxID=2654982 RepID=A0A7W8V8T0_PARAM|nr:restriction endonuclease subunit S [Paraburkholderia atlantica]MBB5427466.1 type I restriction enzyme S subunit [Paraburkholderia atlantica]
MKVINSYPDLAPRELGWTSTVPASWKVLPCRALVIEQNEKNENSWNQNYLSLMANIGVIPYEEKGDVGNKKPDDLSKCKVVRKGDLVINSMNYGIGSFGLSMLDGVCSPVYIVLKPKEDIVHERYALRIFESKSFQRYAQSFGAGILDHRAAIGWDDLKNINVGVPSLEEQAVILQQLDRETARIDGLVEKKTRFIELLREKRQAHITRAVTRGLDPHVKMMDSGVEWLGDVPEHWKVIRLQYVITGIEQGWSPECLATPAEVDEWGVVKSGCVNGGLFAPEQNKKLPANLEPRPEIAIKSGDILMSRASGSSDLIGSVGMVGEFSGSLMLSDKIFRINLNGCIIKQFFVLIMGSRVVRTQIVNAISGAEGLANNLPQARIKKFWIALPDIEEQAKIVDFVWKSTARLDALIEKTERSIELLKERRSALVTAAVTGQIDLRDMGVAASKITVRKTA